MQVLEHVQVVQPVGLRGDAWAASRLEGKAGNKEQEGINKEDEYPLRADWE